MAEQITAIAKKVGVAAPEPCRTVRTNRTMTSPFKFGGGDENPQPRSTCGAKARRTVTAAGAESQAQPRAFNPAGWSTQPAPVYFSILGT